MAKVIMVQGTASNAGKSLVATGLCRIFRQDGFAVAPFKSQNMALNSFITADGLEMGRAQVAQAEAAGIEPSVLMNPILLKPTGDSTSQVIVNGEVVENMRAAEYYRRKSEFLPAVRAAYGALAGRYDIIVIEGAGSPAEINLAENDFVNMGLAAMVDAPVLLVGDIDRGGVFASLYGTVALLPPGDRTRVKGFVINKFRGDVSILRPGLKQLEELAGVPVVGVIPWLWVDIDDEDSVSSRLDARASARPVDVAVVRLPRIANFTDFNALERHPAVGVRYVDRMRDLGRPDLVILPGTKNTMADLSWMRQNGLEAGVKKLADAGTPVIGVCGGYQMLGGILSDPDGVEHGGTMRGMELLPLETIFTSGKVRTRVSGRACRPEGFFSCLGGAEFEGYEIHMGETRSDQPLAPFAILDENGRIYNDGAVRGNVLGSYVHGLFDSGSLVCCLAEALLSAKGIAAGSFEAEDHAIYKERQYDQLASVMRETMDMEAVYRIIESTPSASVP